VRFAVFRARWYKGYWTGGTLLMAGDNAEHAITYWVIWQQFHSPLLGGFAVVSHWLPHLFFSIPFGALADRFDARRIIQVALGLFMAASVAWGVLILTDSLEPWHAVVLLLVHGFASALWHPADKLMIYDMVGREQLPSGIRLMATGLSLGMVVGPAIGAALLFTVGPAIGMLLNVALYLPFLVYLIVLPLDGHDRAGGAVARMGLRDVFSVIRELPKYPAILVVRALQTGIGLLIGTALLPLFPEFGTLLGLEESGLGYALLIVAMAAGAVIGGFVLEAVGALRPTPRVAVIGGAVFALAVLVFGISRNFALTLVALLIAGFATILAESVSQTVVQLAAPDAQRGRFVGAAQVTALGSRAGSGLVMGVLGAALGVTGAVTVTSATLLVITLVLLALATALRGRGGRASAAAAADTTPGKPVTG